MRVFRLATGLLLAAGTILMAHSLSMPVKAWLSVRLMERAWERTLAGDAGARPWPWMDSTPVARLAVPDHNRDYVVMQGASGAVLAFAPGWHEGSDRPGQGGVTLISGHRDTHFSFLRNLKKGQEMVLTDAAGMSRSYEVEELAVVQEPEIHVNVGKKGGILLLTTCYPFSNWQAGGQMRFVVVARERQPDLLVAAN